MKDNQELESVSSATFQLLETNEKGEYKYSFHYRIGKEIGAGYNLETGEPTDIYAKMSIECKNPISDEKYEKFHKGVFLNTVAQHDSENAKYIFPISKEEYDKEMSDDEE